MESDTTETLAVAEPPKESPKHPQRDFTASINGGRATQRMAPSIGRRVWYWPSQHDKDQHGFVILYDSQAVDVGICCIHESGNDGPDLVGVAGFDHACEPVGDPQTRLYMPDEVTDEMRAAGGFAQWIPFQAAEATRRIATEYLTAAKDVIRAAEPPGEPKPIYQKQVG
jgi:hypothetical protein